MRFLDHLARLPAQRLHRPRGSLVFQRGDAVRHVFAVTSGAVHLLRRQPDGAGFTLQRAGPGDILGEASIMSACYHCAAEAVEASELRRWSRAAVQELIATDHEAAAAYAAHLATEVRSARLRAEIVSLRRVADRLDAWLTWHDGALPPRGSWQHLAAELGVSPEALYRELARRRPAA